MSEPPATPTGTGATSAAVTCAECPISLLCLSGHVPVHAIFHCDECGRIGFYDENWQVPETFICANVPQLRAALFKAQLSDGEFKACDACLREIMNRYTGAYQKRKGPRHG
jgi:hypothetical protein